MLDAPIADVPHFVRDANGVPSDFWNRVYDFVEARGYEYMIVTGKHDETLCRDMGGYHLIGGPSPRGNGLQHVVVGLNGHMVFDPHPSRAGLIGERAKYYFQYLVKVD